MARHTAATLTLTFLVAFSARAEQTVPAAPVPAFERVEKDSPRATPAGTTFTAPAGWRMTTEGPMVLLDPPEADSHVAIVDATAKDAAVAAAWAAYKPGFSRPLKISMPQTSREGWDERKVYEYETSPNERVVVSAMAWRAGDAWTVILLDGSEPTFERSWESPTRSTRTRSSSPRRTRRR